jgi:hypothetical protein
MNGVEGAALLQRLSYRGAAGIELGLECACEAPELILGRAAP